MTVELGAITHKEFQVLISDLIDDPFPSDSPRLANEVRALLKRLEKYEQQLLNDDDYFKDDVPADRTQSFTKEELAEATKQINQQLARPIRDEPQA